MNQYIRYGIFLFIAYAILSWTFTAFPVPIQIRQHLGF
jgi:hypothetical protein